MPADTNQQGRFEPIHDAHAIEQVALVLQLDRPLENDKFSEARKIAEGFKDDLPGRSEIQSVRLAFGVSGQVPPVSPWPETGTVFSRTRADGAIESELRMERASITFRTLVYTRWNAIWSQARKYLEAIIPKYVVQGRISGISLNFVDKFIWQGVLADCRPNLLLRKGSRYLCPHVFDAPDLWHSHTGAFLHPDAQTKRLLNVNVDLIDENGPDGLRRAVVITTVLTDMMNQPGYTSLEVTGKAAAEEFDAHMQQLHDFGKITFGNIINDEMSKRIALTD